MADYDMIDRLHRAKMQEGGDRLLAALRREHPHIIRHLEQRSGREGGQP
jgi:hypothetical protein